MLPYWSILYFLQHILFLSQQKEKNNSIHGYPFYDRTPKCGTQHDVVFVTFGVFLPEGIPVDMYVPFQ